MDTQTLGERLAMHRRRKHLRQLDIATALGCKPSDIHRVERGHVSNPHWERVVAWAKVLDISLDELAGREVIGRGNA